MVLYDLCGGDGGGVWAVVLGGGEVGVAVAERTAGAGGEEGLRG